MNPVSCMEPWTRSLCQVISPQHSDHLPPQAEQTSAGGSGGHYDGHKSTKGASKMRRDLINSEIAVLRELLPLPASTRQRLSQLQLMALVCVYVRKANYFQQVYKQLEQDMPPTPSMGFTKAMNGFLLITCQNGKLLYISENAAEYLGHSMEDLLIHGDSVYDIIDKQDQQSVQNELLRGSGCQLGGTSAAQAVSTDTRHFLCRINVSRNARRQMRFGDQKLVLVRGQYHSYLPLCSRNEPVFVALCTPVVMPETRESVAQAATNLFTSTHTMAMKFISIDQNGEHHLEYRQDQLKGLSWYQLLHWSNMKELQEKHKLMVSSEQDRCSVLLLRLQTRSGLWLWCHCVLQVKEPGESSQQSVIVCTCQILSEDEAAIMRNNSWLYQYYSMQGKISYGYGYESASHTAGSYYPHMYGYSASHMPAQSTGATIDTSLSQHAYLQHHQAQVQSLQSHMYHHTHGQYIPGVQQHHQIQPIHDNIQQNFSSAGTAYQQMACHSQFNSTGGSQAVDFPAGYWSRYEQTSSSSVAANYQSMICSASSATEQDPHCLSASNAVHSSIESPLKRPPTPPESPQQISAKDCIARGESSSVLGTIIDSSQQHDPLPPLKRRLIAYHQNHNHHNHTTIEQDYKNDSSFSLPASTWTTRGSTSSGNGSQRMLTDTYTFSNNQNHLLRGAVSGSNGSHINEAEDHCGAIALGSTQESYGSALVARPAAVRVARQLSHKLSLQNTTPTPEVDSTQNESTPAWILSPPWSEGNQFVPEVSACSETGAAMTSPQTSVSAAIRSLDVLTAEQRLVMTASWADASLMYPFYIATPSPSSGSSEESLPASTWRDTQTAAGEPGQGMTPGTQQHCTDYQYSPHHRHPLSHQAARSSNSSSIDSPSYLTLESRSRQSGHAQL